MTPAWRTVAASLIAAASAASGQSASPALSALTRADLCVTEGALEETGGASIAVAVPKMRAYVNRRNADSVELRFTYLGPTAVEAQLGSGASRRQLGIKLRAENACNLLYVMWRIDPESAVVVSVKSNPGQEQSAQCASHGYRNLRPIFTAAVPRLRPGESHRLLAQIHNDELWAYVDGTRVWEGRLGEAAAALEGPAGVRTDNVRLEFVLAIEAAAAATAPLPHCRKGQQDSE